MLNYIYSIYDRKTQYYLPVFAMRADADAIRQFAEIVTSSDTPISKYPADYDLVRLGAIDLNTGYIQPETPVGTIVNGLVCLQNANTERARYRASLAQLDIEQVIGENP